MTPDDGSGTTGMVAAQLGRDAVLIDINEEYAEIARRRIAAYGVLEVATRDGTPAGPVGQVAML